VKSVINQLPRFALFFPFRATRGDKSVQAQANRTGGKSFRKQGKVEPIENRQLPANPYKIGLPEVRDQEVGFESTRPDHLNS
jgi:hypothetical protein